MKWVVSVWSSDVNDWLNIAAFVTEDLANSYRNWCAHVNPPSTYRVVAVSDAA